MQKWRSQIILMIALLITAPVLYANLHSGITQPASSLISLDFRNIPAADLLQLLAEFKGINIVISDQVKDNISLNLQNVSWEQALNTILTMEGLTKHVQGNILFIEPLGQLNNEVEANAPLTSQLIHLHYAKASDMAALLQGKENSALSPRGNVTVDNRTNSLWVQDTSSHLKTIQAMLANFDTPTQQVLIKARIVNVDKNFMRDLGLKFSSTQGNLNNNTDGLNMDMPSNRQPNHLTIAIAKIGQNNLIDLELAALESEGHAKIISNPQLITANRQAAHIESGQEIPYQEKTSSGATNVAFKKAVLSLKVTPDVIAPNKILLNLTINQDKISSILVNGVPAINTQEVQAQVLANNHDTIVLGGIYEQSQRNVAERVPFLGSMPLLGALFRNTHLQTEQRELLVFITPQIVRQAL